MRNTKTRKQKVIYVDILCYLKISIMIQWNSIVHCGGVIKLSLFLHILLSACLYDSVWVHLCPGSSHYPGAAHWSVVCLLQHQVLSCRHSRQSHHWEEVLADLWGSEVVSDSGVLGAVLVYVQTLPLPTARRDSQCAGDDRGHSWQVVRPGGGVYARTKRVLSHHHNVQYCSTVS